MGPLIAIAAEIGAPVVGRILAQKLGPANAGLVTEVLRQIADRAGTTPQALPEFAQTEPEKVTAAIAAVEPLAPGLVEMYRDGLAGQFALLKSEEQEPLWFRAWRPLGMYALGLFWAWNMILLHIANAVWKIALPPTDAGVLIQLSALYMGLYMGGHTLKDVAGKWNPAKALAP